MNFERDLWIVLTFFSGIYMFCACCFVQSLYDGLHEVNAELWKDIISLQQDWIGKCDGTQLKFALEVTGISCGQHYVYPQVNVKVLFHVTNFNITILSTGAKMLFIHVFIQFLQIYHHCLFYVSLLSCLLTIRICSFIYIYEHMHMLLCLQWQYW